MIEKQCEAMNNACGDLHLKDGYVCSKCKNKGFVYKIRNNEIISSHCECRQVRKSINILKQSGLMDFVDSKRFDNYEVTEEWQRKIKDKAISFINQDDVKWFYIGGQVGSGKTHLCTAICSHFLNEGKPTRYMLWTEVAKQLKANVNDDSYMDIIQPYKDVEVLYIDDFFKVKSGQMPTGADVNIAFEILNSRLLSKDKITIISSEFTLNELLEVDEGTISRIVEHAKNFAINIGKDTTKNYRLKLKETI